MSHSLTSSDQKWFKFYEFSKMVVTMSAVSCAIVGDGMVGKTCLAKQFSGLEVTENYVATIMDIFSGTASAYGEQYKINIKDTAGQVRILFLSFYSK